MPGGIAGQNYGAIIQCRNSGSINTTEVDAELDLDAINREQLNAAENVPVCTDIGGIAGYSSGILQSCTNSGSVGYAHVGYNIGGIVGRQSGYLDGCANSGDILGRKDVGGIAGQLEPEVRLLYDQGQMGELLDALDGLGDSAGPDAAGFCGALPTLCRTGWTPSPPGRTRPGRQWAIWRTPPRTGPMRISRSSTASRPGSPGSSTSWRRSWMTPSM